MTILNRIQVWSLHKSYAFLYSIYTGRVFFFAASKRLALPKKEEQKNKLFHFCPEHIHMRKRRAAKGGGGGLVWPQWGPSPLAISPVCTATRQHPFFPSHRRFKYLMASKLPWALLDSRRPPRTHIDDKVVRAHKQTEG